VDFPLNIFIHSFMLHLNHNNKFLTEGLIAHICCKQTGAIVLGGFVLTFSIHLWLTDTHHESLNLLISFQCTTILPSVFQHCWFSESKVISPIKNLCYISKKFSSWTSKPKFISKIAVKKIVVQKENREMFHKPSKNPKELFLKCLWHCMYSMINSHCLRKISSSRFH